MCRVFFVCVSMWWYWHSFPSWTCGAQVHKSWLLLLQHQVSMCVFRGVDPSMVVLCWWCCCVMVASPSFGSAGAPALPKYVSLTTHAGRSGVKPVPMSVRHRERECVWIGLMGVVRRHAYLTQILPGGVCCWWCCVVYGCALVAAVFVMPLSFPAFPPLTALSLS